MAEIDKLKRRATKLYRSIRSRANNANCGNALLSYISPDHEAEQRELDTILDRLRSIDPAFPKGR